MNRERARELLPIIQAFAEGKKVQHRSRDLSMSAWIGIDDNAPFDYSEEELEWRIKPEPFECWLEVDSEGYATGKNFMGVEPTIVTQDCTYIHMREVEE